MIDKINKLAAYVRISSDKQDTQRQEERIKATGQTIDYWFRDNIGKNPQGRFKPSLLIVKTDSASRMLTS